MKKLLWIIAVLVALCGRIEHRTLMMPSPIHASDVGDDGQSDAGEGEDDGSDDGSTDDSGQDGED